MTAAELRARAVECLRRGRPAEGLAAARAAAVLAPDDAAVLATLGSALLLAEAWAEALAAIERAMRLGAANPALLGNRGFALLRLGRARDAFAQFEALPQDDPRIARGRREALGKVLQDLDTGDVALDRLSFEESRAREICRLLPDNAEAFNNLGVVLTHRGDFAAAADAFRRAVALDPGYLWAHSNLLFCLNYDPTVDDDALAAAHAEWDARHGLGLPAPAIRDPRPDRRLRLGYVSPTLSRHPVGWFLAAVLENHDPEAVAVTVYDCGSTQDDLNARMRRAAPDWHLVDGDDDALAARIRRDGIDVLVDLAGHTANHRLGVFARRPAPLQVSWLGWFHTTGLAAIDAVLMDAHTVPAGAERWFTERLVRLPDTRFCYAPPEKAPAPAPPPERPVTFGSFNNLIKITPEVAALWARVLAAVPGSRLCLKWKSLADPAVRARVAETFAAHGVDPARLELRGRSQHAAMLAEYADIDLALDPFPFSGCLTSCEALWMGVPVLTLAGHRPVSRQTHALLANLGLTGLLSAADADDYVAKAAALAADRDTRMALRRDLRTRMANSPLCDGAGFTRALEAALRELWREKCRR